MPPLSQLMQMGPGNIFGGLGKNLGAGIGGGITKQIRRPLFNKLIDKFRTGNEDKAKLSTLAQMGLTAAPMQGSEQYPIFEQMFEANQNLLNQRADRSQELWETDPTAAREYLLGEQAMKFGGTGGKGPKDPGLSLEQKNAISNLTTAYNQYLAAQNALFADPTNLEKDAARLQAKQAMNIAKGEAVGVGVDANKVIDTASQSETFGGKLAEQRNIIANERGKNSNLINEVLTKLQGTVDKVLGGATVNKWITNSSLVKDSADQIQHYIDNFNQYKSQPNALFGAVKALGRAIEPGLQVTSDEVKGFLGANAVSSFIGGVQDLGEGFKTLFGPKGKGGLLREAQEAAATDQPKQMWQILVQASNIISMSQNNYNTFLTEAKKNAKNIGGADTAARTKYLPQDDKDLITTAMAEYIDDKVPKTVMSSQMTPLLVGTPMPTDGGIAADLMGKAKTLIAQAEAFLETDKGSDPDREKLRVQIEKTREATKKEDAKAIEQEVGFLGQIINALLGLETDENGNSTLKVENLNVAGVPLGDQKVRISDEEAQRLVESGEW
jgi:hypothetical protein